MKKLIVIFIALITMAAAFAKPLPSDTGKSIYATQISPETRELIEGALPDIERVIEHNTQALDNNRLCAKMLEFSLSLLGEKDKLKRPTIKFLKAINKYNEWLAKYTDALQKRREIFTNMLETGEWGSIETIKYGYTIGERGKAVENNFVKAKAEFDAAVRAYNLKRGM